VRQYPQIADQLVLRVWGGQGVVRDNLVPEAEASPRSQSSYLGHGRSNLTWTRTKCLLALYHNLSFHGGRQRPVRNSPSRGVSRKQKKKVISPTLTSSTSSFCTRSSSSHCQKPYHSRADAYTPSSNPPLRPSTPTISSVGTSSHRQSLPRSSLSPYVSHSAPRPSSTRSSRAYTAPRSSPTHPSSPAASSDI
jgi:hypothetical protein